MTNVKVITLFSGYDSQCLALDRLKEEHPDFDYDLLAWSEIDKYAIQAHNLIYPQWADRNLGDVSKIDWEQYPEFKDCDLLTYSFPCTDISAAGKQQGFDKDSGTRSGLLWECEKAIKHLRPKYLLMENVKALVSKKFMPLFQEWINLVDDELHYKSQWRILNATSFGIPQNRERCFMLSIREDIMRGYDFPEPFPLTKTLDDVLEEEVDERFYLKNDRIEDLLTSTIEEMKKKDGYKFKAKKKGLKITSVTFENSISPECSCGTGYSIPDVFSITFNDGTTKTIKVDIWYSPADAIKNIFYKALRCFPYVDNKEEAYAMYVEEIVANKRCPYTREQLLYEIPKGDGVS